MTKNKSQEASSKVDEKQICGIIMPISGNDQYSAEHWSDVKAILEEVIIDAGFVPNIVSDADEIGIIHNRIVSNIYNNPIIICDVSSKNANVMFELGLRLAFDKATIIIKDDITNYNFDTGVIEHLAYPSDLRYTAINNFKLKLKEKIVATYNASLKSDYSTFLKSFVQYKPKLEVEEISSQEYILKQLENINRQLSTLNGAKKSPLKIGTNNLTYSFHHFIPRPGSADHLIMGAFKKFLTNNLDSEELPLSTHSGLIRDFLLHVKSSNDKELLNLAPSVIMEAISRLIESDHELNAILGKSSMV